MVFGAVLAVSFLLGSIPWGVIISRVFYHTDVRQHGSGNIGTTNAFRTMGKVGGVAVFLLDFGKGLLAGWLATVMVTNFVLPYGGLHSLSMNAFLGAAFFGCVTGHIFSPWLNFKGGKGIAVAIGCLFMTYGPVISVLELTIFAVLVLATRYVSVGSIASAAACPFFALYCFWGDWPAVILCTAGASFVVWAHRGNIARLRAGTESRIGSKGDK
jgi:acyl phosphate:glycerol-3-phosphate acyltransferase